jgi:hypothetical protein
MTATEQREITMPDGSVRLRAVKPESDNERRIREDGLCASVVNRIEAELKAGQALISAKSHLATMQREEDELLHRVTATDDEIRVANSRTMVARNEVERLETDYTKAWSALESSVVACHPLYAELQIHLMDRVRARISKAVVTAAEWPIDNEPDKQRQNVMCAVWALSTPIRIIGSLAPSPFRIGLRTNGDSRLVFAARDLVEKWRKLREWEVKSRICAS